jgi:hypothetical protein
MIERLKSAVTKDEIKEVLVDILDSDLYQNEEVKSYINSREDLVEILTKMKTKMKTNLEKLMSDFDAYNKERHPELVPENPNSMEERMSLLKKYNEKNSQN